VRNVDTSGSANRSGASPSSSWLQPDALAVRPSPVGAVFFMVSLFEPVFGRVFFVDAIFRRTSRCDALQATIHLPAKRRTQHRTTVDCNQHICDLVSPIHRPSRARRSVSRRSTSMRSRRRLVLCAAPIHLSVEHDATPLDGKRDRSYTSASACESDRVHRSHDMCTGTHGQAT
jgi:hypothetical protein